MVTDVSTTWAEVTADDDFCQVVETSVTTADNSSSQDYTHPDDQTTLLHVTPGSNHLLNENILIIVTSDSVVLL